MSLNKQSMTTRQTSASSTSLRSAKKVTRNNQRTPRRRAASLPRHSLVESESVDGPSPLAELYERPEFVRGWHNDASFHVAENVLHLRRYRGLKQAEVATAMTTSQSAIARIEGGDDNITLRTLKRLVIALKGRLLISIPPEELAPANLIRRWWLAPAQSSTSTTEWLPVFVLQHQGGRHAVVGLRKGQTTKPVHMLSGATKSTS
jgi:transcriptional regulator with XRE-family HTH domain